MKNDESLVSLIYAIEKKDELFNEGFNTIYLYVEESEIINARDILVREYKGLRHPKYNDLYIFGGVTVDKPSYENDSSKLKDLEYGLQFTGSIYEFPDNINVIAEELNLPILKGRFE
jgi:hypothetical protein